MKRTTEKLSIKLVFVFVLFRPKLPSGSDGPKARCVFAEGFKENIQGLLNNILLSTKR